MINRSELKTEQQNNNSKNIDSMSISNILLTINGEDHKIASIIEKAIPKIEKIVHHTLKSVKSGGRVFYIGAGTSGRLGVLDASELRPTFSLQKNIFIALIAGGDKALRNSVEGAEDDKQSIIKELKSYSITKNDTIIGISCSGAADYVVTGLSYARKSKAKTVYIVTNPKPLYMVNVDVLLTLDTGPEILAGSTRMKAGTATKMVLNMISTSTMIRLGKVYGNLMVDLMAVNKKLLDRGLRIISQVRGLNYEESEVLLKNANYSVKCAIVMSFLNCSLKEAKKELESSNGFLSKVLNG